MIEKIKDLSSQGESWIDVDTYVCRSDYETARLAAGGLVQVCKQVVTGKTDTAFSMARPPGHHATKTHSMGFCLFNNIALAAHALSKEGKRVLIFDHDVHHGNGTQDIFYERDDVIYQSFHLYPHYPGTGSIEEIGTGKGEGYTINAPLSHGTGNDGISQLLDEVFIPIARQFKPDFILVSSGYDSHHADPLGGFTLTSNFFGEMIAKFQKVQPKLACTLEGGYNFSWIGKCLVSQIGQMIGNPVKFDDSIKEETTAKSVVDNIKNELGAYWKL
jgi:acetoin utilization deacetylase AcuC-like enzyme